MVHRGLVGLLSHTIAGLLLGLLLPLPSANGRRMPEPTFNYDKSGTDWPEPCPSGAAQSPVNIVASRVEAGADVRGFYIEYEKSTPVTLSNDVAIGLAPKSGSDNYLFTSEGKFRLAQLHLHAYSEHTLEGAVFPLELHFVHRQESTNKLSVVAVLFDLHPDDIDNPILDRLVHDIPMNREDVRNFTTDLEEMFDTIVAADPHGTPAPLDYYTYHGSLTIPPCSENVTWYIRQHHATASVRQWLAVLAGNRAVWREQLTARPIQPLHGRTISKHTVVPRSTYP